MLGGPLSAFIWDVQVPYKPGKSSTIELPEAHKQSLLPLPSSFKTLRMPEVPVNFEKLPLPRTVGGSQLKRVGRRGSQIQAGPAVIGLEASASESERMVLRLRLGHSKRVLLLAGAEGAVPTPQR